jgi:hypothetical protein
MKVCIGIVCIGEKYIQDFATTFEPSVRAYANKYGYDLKLFTSFLSSETHPNCISFQKCLVPNQLKDYDCVVVMDADIYIHDNTPPIHTLLTEKIGIVNEVGQVSPEQYKALGFASDPIEYYRLGGFDLRTNMILNTGLMLCNPTLHGDLLEAMYRKYIQDAPTHPRKFHYEQACIGYELQTQHMCSLLDNTWNHIYMYDTVLGIRSPSCYCMHFAGYGSRHLARYLTTHGLQSRIRWGIQKKW